VDTCEGTGQHVGEDHLWSTTAYIGGYCLSAGTYRYTINEKFRDGRNSGNGGITLAMSAG
jgi:hypothetical protein